MSDVRTLLRCLVTLAMVREAFPRVIEFSLSHSYSLI